MERLYSFKYSEYSSPDQLSGEEAEAVKAAMKASKNSYSPYSEFRVGAAIVLENGEILSASNQESEVYPSGMCAERVLLYYYQANFSEVKIKTLAIYSPDSPNITPCGACRQVMLDSEKRQGEPIKVIMASDNGGKIIRSAETLLPFCFSLPQRKEK